MQSVVQHTDLCEFQTQRIFFVFDTVATVSIVDLYQSPDIGL